jgi:hypothetical protein
MDLAFVVTVASITIGATLIFGVLDRWLDRRDARRRDMAHKENRWLR